VVRSLWAAERSSWLVGAFVLLGEAVVRRELVWPVVVSVVVAEDMEMKVSPCEWVAG
jgi:hypothetical protein